MDNTLRYAINLFISYSAIPTMCSLLFSLAFWGESIRRNGKRAVAATVLFSVYTDITVQLLPTLVHLFNALGAFILLTAVIFKSTPLRVRLRIALTGWFIAILNEGLFGGIAMMVYGRQANFEDPLMAIMFMWPPSFLYLGLALWIRKKNRNPGDSVSAFLHNKKNQELALVLLFIFIQFFVCILGLTGVLGDGFDVSGLLPYTAFAASGLSIVAIVLAVRWMARSTEEAVRQTQEHYIGDMNRLFTTIRGQRHDFLNHVMVIQGFLKLKKYEDLERYVKEYTGVLTDMNELVQIGHPALSALIQSKLMAAEAAKIRLTYSFTGMEQLSMGAKSVDLVKIIGNLLDNALDEASLLEPQDRWVEVTGSVEGGSVWLTTRNPGRVITETDRMKLFQPGYSTKQDGQHSGIGLSVVKERVDYYKGSIHVDSGDEHGTVFTVRLPIANRSGGRKELD